MFVSTKCLLSLVSINAVCAWTPPQELLLERRTFFATSTTAIIVAAPSLAHATERAVGSGEKACREAGNCLEKGEWDGAVGWEWGGKDRCDPADPLCGADGKMRDSPLTGKPVPPVPVLNNSEVKFTDVVAIQIEIGRGEVGVLKIGLYGNEAQGYVQQLVSFLSKTGLTTASISEAKQMIGVFQVPVSLSTGGVVSSIVPNTSVEFGVPNQGFAFAREKGLRLVGEDFRPQPRPVAINSPTVVRPHDCAGLVSVPGKGIGYGGTGFEQEDECFESAFLITGTSVPTFDSSKRRVVGQLLDAQSMAFLERLANLPTKRGIRGVIPGQTNGPPLQKVVVREVQVSKVSQS